MANQTGVQFQQKIIEYEIYEFPDLSSAQRAIMKSVHRMDDENVYPGKHTEVYFSPINSKLMDINIRAILRENGGNLTRIKYVGEAEKSF